VHVSGFGLVLNRVVQMLGRTVTAFHHGDTVEISMGNQSLRNTSSPSTGSLKLLLQSDTEIILEQLLMSISFRLFLSSLDLRSSPS